MLRSILLFCFTFVLCAADPAPLAIGSIAPDFSLPGVDGKVHNLSEFRSSEVLAVVFTCNHCPTAQLYEMRINRLAEQYRAKGVAFVAIAPNDPEAVRLDELGYSDVNDGLDDMKIRAKFRNYQMPYLYDGESQKVSRAYGAQATPHVFLFDSNRKLQYQGRVDDNQRENLVKVHDARDAIEALLAGKPVAMANRPVFGCSVKWKDKISGRVAERARLEKEPVNVELVSEAGLKTLRKNPTGKVLLVNFWATWCGPCLTEFPDLQETFRMYRNRDFDFVTVAANMPDEQEGVMRVLKRYHASTRNLLFDSTDIYKMQQAFDPQWEAGVPFTMLIAPGGRVLYQKQGLVDILEMRRIVLANLPDSDYRGHRDYWAASLSPK
ncbi:MAG: redoxin family protein [Bryobacterales bacterium]|nr:redoxin family protein [Bryobacterales bacterium]